MDTGRGAASLTPQPDTFDQPIGEAQPLFVVNVKGVEPGPCGLRLPPGRRVGPGNPLSLRAAPLQLVCATKAWSKGVPPRAYLPDVVAGRARKRPEGPGGPSCALPRPGTPASLPYVAQPGKRFRPGVLPCDGLYHWPPGRRRRVMGATWPPNARTCLPPSDGPYTANALLLALIRCALTLAERVQRWRGHGATA